MDNVFYNFSTDDASNSSDNDYTDSDDDTPASIQNKKMWKLITAMNDEEPASVSSVICSDENCKNLNRSTYKDVSVKVNSDIYELDRVKLALKSDYFEKLFTGDFDKKENEHLEIYTIDSDTFSTVVDIIYDENDLDTALNVDNFAALLLAMDYLQMEIDLKVFRDFMTKNLKIPLLQYTDVCKLLSSIGDNSNFEYLLPTIFQYLSIHLIEVLQFQDFYSLSFELVVKIITKNRFPRYTKEKRKIARICTEWICKDVVNRLRHMTALVNAAKYRYGFHFRIDGQSMNSQFLLDIDDAVKQKTEMERYFNNLLNQSGQIDPAEQESKENNMNDALVFSIINKMDEDTKWTSFLENNYFYDITVKVAGKIYKLHRCKLESKSDYFVEKDENDDDDDKDESKDKEEKPPKPSKRDEEVLLEDIDQLTFEAVIEFIYFERIDFDSNVKITDFLKASVSLDIYELGDVCKSHIITHLDTTRIADEFIKILNFIIGKDDFKELCGTFRNHIISTWPKIGTMPDFCTISCAILESILTLDKLEISHPDEILDICSKWIAHDPQNRYSLLPRIANTISCNYMINHDNRVTENPHDWNHCTQQFVKDKLWETLSSISSVISGQNAVNEPELTQQPMFIATVKENGLLDILDLEFNKIATIHSLKSSCRNEPSAALIDDNLFLLFKFTKNYSFHVYNLSTKKFFSLALFHRLMTTGVNHNFTLLNCNGELYCCCEDGSVLKYSIELNRWMVFIKRIEGRFKLLFTSNGNTLYRLSRVTETRRYIAEAYDFQQNLWISLPEFPSRLHKWYFSKYYPTSVTIINDNFAILFDTDIVLFNHRLQLWQDFEISISNVSNRSTEYGSSIFTQHQGNLLCMRDKKIWSVSPSDGESTSNQIILPDKYSKIVAIHSVYK